MNKSISRTTATLFALSLLALVSPPLVPPTSRAQGATEGPTAAAANGSYRQTNLVSDLPGVALVEDKLLVNPWGIAAGPAGPFAVANNGSDTATFYAGDVSGSPLVRATPPSPGSVKIEPAPTPATARALPSAAVANTTNGFVVPAPDGAGVPAAPARFLFATQTGTISAWNATRGDSAVVVVNRPGALYTGLTVAGDLLYAVDFVAGRIDVYDSSFADVTASLAGGFANPLVPSDFRPFNVQNLNGSLYVTYAQFNRHSLDPDRGAGFGYVRKFDQAGVRDTAFAINQGPLNAPWGLALAPASFGALSNTLLVGNTGDTFNLPAVSGFDPATGAFVGSMVTEGGAPLRIEDLWGLAFGNGAEAGDASTLYFTAGFGSRQHGLFGSLRPAAAAASLVQFSSAFDFTHSALYFTTENAGHVDITVTRTGDVSSTASVNYATYDIGAKQKNDYQIALGKLTFNPGETSKTIRVFIVDDNNWSGGSTTEFGLVLSNAVGAGVGTPAKASVSVSDDEFDTPKPGNPIDDPSFFVRQHYLDFLNRDPDAEGFAFWTNQMTNCGSADLLVCRVNVSAAFFLSIEFQNTGYLAYLTHRAAFGPTASGSPAPVLYGTFMRDTQALQRGYAFGRPGAEAVLEANKAAYFADFVTRPEFVSKYPSTLTNEQYVDSLLVSANLSPNDFIVNMTNSQESPPANPTTSGGARRPASYGTARYQLNAGATALTLTATVNNIDFTGSQTADTNDNLTNAHIHASSAETAATRPVVWGFIGTPFNDNNPNDAVVTPFGSGVGGTVSAKWDAPEGNGTTLAAQLSNLREGRAYVNFHTVQFGGGEIRGNFPALGAFRDSLVAGLNAGTSTRAAVLRAVAEAQALRTREFNAAFVTMEYFGYLRRDPDTAGFNFWLNKLNEFGGNYITAEMVKAFITSIEYRQRFGQ